MLDAALAAVAVYAAYGVSAALGRDINDGMSLRHLTSFECAMLAGAALAVTAHVLELHDPLMRRRQFWLLWQRAMAAAAIALAISALVTGGVLYRQVGRLILLQTFLYLPPLMVLARWLVWRGSSRCKWRVWVVEDGQAQTGLQSMIDRFGLSMELLKDVPGGETGKMELAQKCRQMEINEIVIARRSREKWGGDFGFMACLDCGVRVSDFSHFVERNFLQVAVEHIDEDWFLALDLRLIYSLYQPFKRGLDVGVALAGLVVSAPLLLLAALAIYLEDRGTVFYGQVRVGRLKKPFTIWKLRTMRKDAEAAGAQWAVEDDLRATRVGRILRRSRVDELPQFWNVLRGDMSLVGPRPERPEFVEKLGESIPFYAQRHLVKPGLTGWAQINYPYGASVEDARNKLRYDLYYLKHASPGLDGQIILRTMGVLMRGAR